MALVGICQAEAGTGEAGGTTGRSSGRPAGRPARGCAGGTEPGGGRPQPALQAAPTAAAASGAQPPKSRSTRWRRWTSPSHSGNRTRRDLGRRCVTLRRPSGPSEPAAVRRRGWDCDARSVITRGLLNRDSCSVITAAGRPPARLLSSCDRVHYSCLSIASRF